MCPHCRSALWDGHKPLRPGRKGKGLIEGTRAFLLMAAFKERYPCQEVPYGASAALAVEFGLSRERARQIRNAYGASLIHKDARAHCMRCGAVMGKGSARELCRSCLYVDVVCDQCGTLFKRLASSYLGRNANGYMKGLYTGRAFCSRACYAAYYRGRERPFTPEHIEALRAAGKRRLREKETS